MSSKIKVNLIYNFTIFQNDDDLTISRTTLMSTLYKHRNIILLYILNHLILLRFQT